ncbi:MAG: protein kinase, partial [Planctomycetota bacterium]|nr:protein kinase [Planctomycetota bacterium]
AAQSPPPAVLPPRSDGLMTVAVRRDNLPGAFQPPAGQAPGGTISPVEMSIITPPPPSAGKPPPHKAGNRAEASTILPCATARPAGMEAGERPVGPAAPPLGCVPVQVAPQAEMSIAIPAETLREGIPHEQADRKPALATPAASPPQAAPPPPAGAKADKSYDQEAFARTIIAGPATGSGAVAAGPEPPAAWTSHVSPQTASPPPPTRTGSAAVPSAAGMETPGNLAPATSSGGHPARMSPPTTAPVDVPAADTAVSSAPEKTEPAGRRLPADALKSRDSGFRAVPLCEGDILADYRLLTALGGWLGGVFLAEKITTGERLIVKVIREALLTGGDAWERFQTEASAASAIGHPNIVRAGKFGNAKGFFYAEAEYVAGENLSAYAARRNHALPWQEAASIMRQAASALAALHERGIAHRDIKPGNILIAPWGEVKLADVGFHHVVGQAAARAAAPLTLDAIGYMAPEQCEGKPSDSRSDQYSLGSAIFESLAGRLPVEGANYATFLHNLMVTGAPPLARFRPDIPAWFADIIDRTLRLDPDARFSSARELLGALEAGMVSEGLIAPGEPSGGRDPVASRRMTLAVLAVLTVLAAAAAAAVVVFVPGVAEFLAGLLSSIPLP